MVVNIPRGVQIDLDNIPDNIDEIVRSTFHDYTNGTAKEYRYQDKLCFIDRCVELLHRSLDGETEVKQLILDRTEWELDEYGNLPDRDEFWSLEFLGECYERGKEDSQMYSKYYSESECMQHNDKYLNNKVMQLLERIIKVVVNYED